MTLIIVRNVASLFLREAVIDGITSVMESTCKHSEGGWPVHVPYGYLWWITQHGQYDAFFASDFGSKLIYVLPALDLVITTITSTEKALKDRDQDKAIRDLIPDFILPAIKDI